MARKDEVRVSENFVKYMRYINTYSDGKYDVYEFEDQSGNIGIHYQIKPELLTDKKQIGLARLFNTKMGKIRVGDICVVMCKAREIHEKQYDNSVFYLNVDRILKPLSKIKLVKKDYRGILTDFAVEEHLTNWEDIHA